MLKTVHILNGDSTAEILKESGISGDRIVWREVLCEGALSVTVGNDEFWGLRYAYFEEELQVNRLDYYDKVIKELIQIEDLTQYDEVVLWFEYDLFCQVNLMGLCTYLLHHYTKSSTYHLVCVGKEKNNADLMTLADYSSQDFEKLYEERIKLTRHDLLFAKECWEVYVANEIQALKQFDFKKNKKFKYFQLTMKQHLKRFSDSDALNQIDSKILQTIQTNAYTKRNILKALLTWQKKETVYGFGDLQYDRYLEKLAPFYEIKNDTYYLNDKGENILKFTKSEVYK